MHLFYGDPAGFPGSLVSFLVWQDGAPGRLGHGRVAEIALAIPAARIGDWLTRAMQRGLRIEGPTREWGEPVLRLRDPDGIIVKLVGTAVPDPGWPAAPARIRAATIWSGLPEQTAAFLRPFGYRGAAVVGGVTRLVSDSDAIDIRDASGFVPGIAGTGVIDHLALRVPDLAALRRHHDALETQSAGAVTLHDRRYFRSLYVREPGDTLIELATDGPGMAADEAADRLGRTLMFPPQVADTDALRLRLPQFARPGEERIAMRDLPFVHLLHRPDAPDGSALLLLHGTGGSETDLMPLARRIAPGALLLGLRGRSTEEGVARFFRRLTMTTFDQDDIRAETAAFAAFWAGAVAAYGLDPARITVMGYSNGANFAGAVMGLHPGLIRRAILMRPMAVLDDLPQADLTGLSVLSLTGARDPYGPHAPRLNDWLAAAGADLDARVVPVGHDLSAEDLTAAAGWMAGAA